MKDEMIWEGRMDEPYARICMYSGPDWDPRVNLTEDQVDHILKKMSYLIEPANPDDFRFHLGQESYVVFIPQLCAIYVMAGGIVRLATEPYETYSVDIGNSLHSYLKDLLAPALQKHHEDAAKAFEKHYEEVCRIPSKEEV